MNIKKKLKNNLFNTYGNVHFLENQSKAFITQTISMENNGTISHQKLIFYI